MKKLREILREALPEIVGGLVVAAVLAITSEVLAVIGKLRVGIGLWAIILVVAGGVWGICAYVGFKRTSPRRRRGRRTWKYPRWRHWALAGLALVSLLTLGGVGYYLYQQGQPPAKVVILVADFDGPEPQKYRVTETMLARLRIAMETYDDVEIRPLGRAITEADGSAVARAEGQKCKASIVIWGWYGVTADVVPLSVHFEVPRPPRCLPVLGPELRGLVQTATVADLESFTLQTRLSTEMAYLSLVTVGMARYAAEDWDSAITRFSNALSQTEEHVPALDQSVVYAFRGNAYASKGNFNRAIADFTRAIEIAPQYKEAHVSRGVAYALKGDYDAALADFAKAVEIDPQYASAYYNRGMAYGSKGDYNGAIADYTKAIEIDPQNTSTYLSRGVAYHFRGDYDAAIADYTKAIEIDPQDKEVYVNRGVAYGSKGDYDAAIADFTKAIEIDPQNTSAYINRGLSYGSKGDYDAAIADYTKAIEIDPQNTSAYLSRGVAYHSRGDYDAAIADYTKAIEIDPQYASAYRNRGLAHEMLGDHETLIADFTKSLELDPSNPGAYYHRGKAYRALGRVTEAIADFDEYLRLKPDADDRTEVEGWIRELRGQ